MENQPIIIFLDLHMITQTIDHLLRIIGLCTVLYWFLWLFTKSSWTVNRRETREVMERAKLAMKMKEDDLKRAKEQKSWETDKKRIAEMEWLDKAEGELFRDT